MLFKECNTIINNMISNKNNKCDRYNAYITYKSIYMYNDKLYCSERCRRKVCLICNSIDNNGILFMNNYLCKGCYNKIKLLLFIVLLQKLYFK